ncbi:hypothetical protein PCANC_21915 [Puccinia coronata f. sp. avenae]|uniref:Uncharacterized protein n=1 Tax=Puccinia coronata f. sp. avenae TaxID=200324 RepID=A0A2N5U7T1_9BASI|nr:hypothetical protein PCANC_21915 [Puccinia coronata f. sp. avenae]
MGPLLEVLKSMWGLDSGTPKGRVQTPARPPPHAARHVHAYNRRAHGEKACQTGVQSLHACLEGVQSLHALWTGVQALHACGLTTLIRVLRYPYNGTGTLIRVPKYPYKGTEGTRSTLIRVLCTLIAGLTSASRFERLT